MDGNELPTDVEVLKQLLVQTQSSLIQSRQQVAELAVTISQQQQQLAAKEQVIADLLKALRGKQRERIDPSQLLLFEIGELEQLIQERREESQPPSRRRKKKRGGRLIPDGLPEEIIEHELPEDQRRCPLDGQPMPRIRWEESKQLDYVPAKFKVIVHRRAVYACPDKHDEAALVTAPKPSQPIEKGLAAAGLLAQVVVSKFGDHLPGYRLEDIFSRHGGEIRRSTIYDWLSGVADLNLPLFELMKQQVLASKIIHTDDTQVKLIDASLRGTRLARFWCYLGDVRHPYAVYDFTEDRTRAGPHAFLKDFRGYLQADAYGGYDGIYLGQDQTASSSSDDAALPEGDAAPQGSEVALQGSVLSEIIPAGVMEVACWAHCRRYWHKAREQDAERAHHVLAVISRLYEVERATTDQTPEFRQLQRAENAAPLLAELGQWLEAQSFLPKSLIGKAATYTRNQWVALNRYVQDGELSIDNNRAERAMRPVAIGRKNWLFVGSPKAGQRAAILMSLVASCKNNGVEPWAYLKDVFTRLASQPTEEQLLELLPDRWLKANPSHGWTIDQRRRDERTNKFN
jgi:transposase